MMVFEEFIKKYGKYMGGIDYEKILNELRNEDEYLKAREELLLGVRLDDAYSINELRREMEKRQLMLKYAMLKNEESKLLSLIEELKLKGYTEPEIKKARIKLRKIRRELRLVRKLLKTFNLSSPH